MPMDSASHHHHQETLESMVGSTKKPRPAEQSLKCPRCESSNTKFCYYNNYSLSQPRYFCKSCRRYWTKGGTLRNVPVGGGCRKNSKRSSSARRNQEHPPPMPTPRLDYDPAFILDNIPRGFHNLYECGPVLNQDMGLMELCSGGAAATTQEIGWQNFGGVEDLNGAWNGIGVGSSTWHGLLNHVIGYN